MDKKLPPLQEMPNVLQLYVAPHLNWWPANGCLYLLGLTGDLWWAKREDNSFYLALLDAGYYGMAIIDRLLSHRPDAATIFIKTIQVLKKDIEREKERRRKMAADPNDVVAAQEKAYDTKFKPPVPDVCIFLSMARPGGPYMNCIKERCAACWDKALKSCGFRAALEAIAHPEKRP